MEAANVFLEVALVLDELPVLILQLQVAGFQLVDLVLVKKLETKGFEDRALGHFGAEKKYFGCVVHQALQRPFLSTDRYKEASVDRKSYGDVLDVGLIGKKGSFKRTFGVV